MHEGTRHRCNQCDFEGKTAVSLKKHKAFIHKETKYPHSKEEANAMWKNKQSAGVRNMNRWYAQHDDSAAALLRQTIALYCIALCCNGVWTTCNMQRGPKDAF